MEPVAQLPRPLAPQSRQPQEPQETAQTFYRHPQTVLHESEDPESAFSAGTISEPEDDDGYELDDAGQIRTDNEGRPIPYRSGTGGGAAAPTPTAGTGIRREDGPTQLPTTYAEIAPHRRQLHRFQHHPWLHRHCQPRSFRRKRSDLSPTQQTMKARASDLVQPGIAYRGTNTPRDLATCWKKMTSGAHIREINHFSYRFEDPREGGLLIAYMHRYVKGGQYLV